MNETTELLLQLIQIALGNKESVDIPSDVNWTKVEELAESQGISSIAFDGLQKVLNSSLIDKSTIIELENLLEWAGQTNRVEIAYKRYTSTLFRLIEILAKYNIKVMVLKGYGYSLNYPIPAHRPCGDIDIYLMGDGAKADMILKSEFAIEIKQNEEKHSVFKFEGLTIENHACIINNNRYPSLSRLECILEDSVNAIYSEDNDCFFPSVSANSLYLPCHIADHFVRGEASIRQLVDWFTFVRKNYQNIDWNQVQRVVKDAGFYKFFCCLNGILVDYLSLDPSYLPNWPRYYKLENRIFNDILYPPKMKDISLIDKVVRFFASSWKFRLVYNENIFVSFFRQARAYALVKWNFGNKTVWEGEKGCVIENCD